MGGETSKPGPEHGGPPILRSLVSGGRLQTVRGARPARGVCRATKTPRSAGSARMRHFSGTGASLRRFDYFLEHRLLASLVTKVQVMEDSGIGPHHLVREKIRHSRQGLVARVRRLPRPSPAPIVAYISWRVTVKNAMLIWSRSQVFLCSCGSVF